MGSLDWEMIRSIVTEPSGIGPCRDALVDILLSSVLEETRVSFNLTRTCNAEVKAAAVPRLREHALCGRIGQMGRQTAAGKEPPLETSAPLETTRRSSSKVWLFGTAKP
jgi:hypothetical protein